MPTYQYTCDACDHEFEELQAFSDAPLTKCPQCKKKKLRRLFGTGASIIFKGSGFYQTDYRSESYKAGAKAEAEATKSNGDGKAESKSESKPAASAAKSGAKSKTGTSE